MSGILSENGLALALVAPFAGSFLGLLVERLPRGEGVVLGRSRCEACGHPLGVRDLVPLVSWALARGRCRHCGVQLGWFHPGIELAALAIALWSAAVVPGALAWVTAGLGWALLVLAAIDWRHMILPDLVTLPLIPAGLAVSAIGGAEGIAWHGVGALAGAASLGAVAAAYRRLTGREGLGLGDVKLFAAAGAWLGWEGLPSVLLIGAATGLATALLRRQGRHAEVAFGPFLALGFWITWLYGPMDLGWG